MSPSVASPPDAPPRENIRKQVEGNSSGRTPRIILWFYERSLKLFSDACCLQDIVPVGKLGKPLYETGETVTPFDSEEGVHKLDQILLARPNWLACHDRQKTVDKAVSVRVLELTRPETRHRQMSGEIRK